MEQEQYDPRFLQGVDDFNRREFFGAHETWEAVWIDENGGAKDFYKGLIQVAVCLLHFGNGNTRGARKLYLSSRRYLDDYRPRYRGVDVDRLLGDVHRCCADLAASAEDPPRGKLDMDLLPVLELAPLARTSGSGA